MNIFFAGLFLCLVLFPHPIFAVNYYVSPTGSDLADGLTPSTAWVSIDYGDKNSLLIPGDTVKVLSGYYKVITTIHLLTDGTPAAPIVYIGVGGTRPVIDLKKDDNDVVKLDGSHTQFIFFTLEDPLDHGIVITGDSCVISSCIIRIIDKIGIQVQSNGNLIYRNVITSTGQEGIKDDVGADDISQIYNNIVYNASGHGIELKGKSSRVINNIIVNNGDRGIKGDVANLVAFNNVWGNPGGNLDGVIDSAGGISVSPGYDTTAIGLFYLTKGSPEIDGGMDLGFPYNGSAPDMGAAEKYNVYYVDPLGDDSNDGLDSATAWASINLGDQLGLLVPGDSVRVLAGQYNLSAGITFSLSGAEDDPIVYEGYGTTPSVFDGGGLGLTLFNLGGSYNVFYRLYIKNVLGDGLEITGSDNLIRNCTFGNISNYGIKILVGGDRTHIYNNTMYSMGSISIYPSSSVKTTRIINNIITGGTNGTWAPNGTIIAHNNMWQVSSPYVSADDSAGGISVDPLFVDTASNDVRLQSGSLCIDAGMDLGYTFSSSAPDIGAWETNIAVSLSISTSVDTMSADSSYQFEVAALDSLGDPTDPGDISWTHTFASGTIDANGIFTPDQVGSGEIIATLVSIGAADTTSTIVVKAGVLYNLVVTPDRDTVSADSTRNFTVSGSDQNGNPVSTFGNLTWSVVGTIGSIDAAGLFTARTTGSGFIKATSDLGPIDLTDTIIVVPGDPFWINILPSSNTIVELTDQQYTALAYDTDSNLISDVTLTSVWSTTDPTGSIDANGLYTAGAYVAPEIWYVKAVFGGTISDSGSVQKITAVSLDYIQIEYFDGIPVGDSSLTTDNDTTKLYCRGYDSGDALLGDVVATWSVIGADTIGSVAPATGNVTTFTLFKPGTGQVVAIDASLNTDTTGTFTVSAGTPAQIVIQPDADTVSADSTQAFSTNSYDADGNASEPELLPSWTVVGGIGTIDAAGLFTAVTTGIGSIIAEGSGIADTAYPVEVIPGELVSIAIVPDNLIISADSAFDFSVSGFDADGNSQFPGNITWSLIGSNGTLDAAGKFEATVVGDGLIVAESDLGFVDTCGLVRVTPGRLVNLEITPDSINISTDSSFKFTATGYDSDNNVTDNGTITWGLIGDIGFINPSGTFVPSDTGVCRITAYNALYDVTDTNQAVVVTTGVLDRLSIAPNTAAITIGDSVTFSVTGYDVTFTVVDPGNIDWSVTGGIGVINSNGVFQAVAGGEGRIIALATASGLADTSGLITVETIDASTQPHGDHLVLPSQESTSILDLILVNNSLTDRSIDRLVPHLTFYGVGSNAQMLLNIDSLSIYREADSDQLFTLADNLLATVAVTADSAVIDIAPLILAPDEPALLFFVTHISALPHDSDSLDCFLNSTDIRCVEGTAVVSDGVLNSSGRQIVNGMISSQITVSSSGIGTISSSNTLEHILSIDIPRNGYSSDELNIISIENSGTATNSDFDSLTLFADDGDNLWEGAGTETYLGQLAFTGSQWTRSGLSVPLNDPYNKFFIAADLSAYPINNASIKMAVSENGISVASGNDGPIDQAVGATDSINIVTDEKLTFEIAPISSNQLRPNKLSSPLFGLNISNTYTSVVNLDSLSLDLLAVDPHGASNTLLRSQVDSAILYFIPEGQSISSTTPDSVLATAVLTSGVFTFSVPGLSISGNGDQLTLAASLFLNDKARNGNTLGLSLTDSNNVFTSVSIQKAGGFPLVNSDLFAVDAFVSGAVTVKTLTNEALFGGQIATEVLSFSIPPNGYASDNLNLIRVKNLGTLDIDAISEIKLRHDLTNNGFTPDDPVVATLDKFADYWQADNIDLAINSQGVNLIITVSVISSQFNAGTLRLSIPVKGITYSSGTNGPDDAAVSAIEERLVFPSDRITTISVAAPSTTITPGTTNKVLLSFALYNGYSNRTQTLKSIAFNNISISQSSPAYADFELGQASLFFDKNRNRVLDTDSLLATGYFADGRMQLAGIDVSLAPESLSYFFLVFNLAENMIDADSLAVEVNSVTDIVFSESVNLNGDMPISGGGYSIVDGAVKKQYKILPVLSRTVSPGDTSITVMTVKPAINGDKTDILEALTIVNKTGADSSDFSTLELWNDSDANNLWSSSDQMLGTFTYNGSAWQLNSLTHSITTSPSALFVIADISSSALSGSAFQASIPINGVQVASGNDGPNDLELISPATFSISGSLLRLSQNIIAEQFSVGQTIPVKFTTTNLQSLDIDSVFGFAKINGDSSAVVLDSVIAGPATITGNDSTSFSFYYTGTAPASLYWQLQAIAQPSSDSSSVLNTGLIDIQNSPANVELSFINSMPTAVIRGQENIFPLSLRLAHPGLPVNAAKVRLDSITLTIEDGNGNPIPADQAISRMVLSTGYTTLTVVDSIPSTTSIMMPFSTPVIIEAEKVAQLTLLIDIAADAAASQFVICLTNSSTVAVVDNNSDAAVPLQAGITFPLKTQLCRIDDPSDQMAIANLNSGLTKANYGQSSVPALLLRLRHPGGVGTSQIQFSEIAFQLLDSAGLPFVPGEMIEKARIIYRNLAIGEALGSDLDSTTISLALGSPVTLNPGDIDSIAIALTISQTSQHNRFQLLIPDSLSLITRDLSSGSPVNAITDPDLLVSGSVFPLSSGWINLLNAAVSPDICFSSTMPAMIPAGLDSLNLLTAILTYDVADDFSPLSLNSFRIETRDTLGNNLDPTQIFDRNGLLINGIISYLPFVELQGAAAIFRFNNNPVVLNPGDTVRIGVIADIETDVPYDNLVITLLSEDVLSLSDNTDTSNHPIPQLDISCGSSLPFLTGPTSIFLRAGMPSLASSNGPVQLVFPGQTDVNLFGSTLNYISDIPQGNIELRGLSGEFFRRDRDGLSSITTASVFSSLSLLIDGTVVSTDSSLAENSVSFIPDTSVQFERGSSTDITIVGNLSPNAAVGNYLLQITDSTALELADAFLGSAISAAMSGGSYPLQTTEISVTSAGLEKSFTNYPNPFIPSIGEPTTISFILSADAHVDLEIFSITGERIKTLMSDNLLSANIQHRTEWYGDNGSGRTVISGTYYCRITARYLSGKTDVFKRKVALVR